MQTDSDFISILVVEDNPADFFLIDEMLRASGLRIGQIYSADRAARALQILQEKSIHLVMLDLSLPDSLGIDTFLRIKELTQAIPVIILTGFDDAETSLDSIKHGVQDYLVKGEFDTNALRKSVEYSIERKKAEEKIHASEERYRQMFYRNPLPELIYDFSSLQILEVNDAAVKKYGYCREEFLQLCMPDILPAKSIPSAAQPEIRLVHIEEEPSRTSKHRKKGGEIITAESIFFSIDYFGRKAIQVQVNDVTERLLLEENLKEQQLLRQRQITEAVLNAQEKERRGIAAELHDNINQILATVRLFLDGAITSTEPRPDLIRMGIDNVTLAIEEIRKLSKALIVPGTIKFGLKQSIEELVRRILVTRKFKILLDLDEMDEKNWDESLKITVYRIIQEQLNNILKYAGATEVDIRIMSAADTILLSVSDNGKGFDTRVESQGVGLTNIRSRAELFNGKVEIDSAPGAGCRLKVVLKAKLPSQKAA